MKITNAQQFDALIVELDKNQCLAQGFRRGTIPSNFKEQWEDISVRVNAHGPPLRDGDGWQKVWRDFKFKTKKKLAANKAECIGVDFPAPYIEYEALEPEPDNYVVADGVVEMGLPLEQEAPTTSKKAKRQKENASVRNQKKPNYRQMFLEKHSAKQAKLLSEISNTLGSVKRSSREYNQTQKKLLEIEERKLKLMEMTNIREDDLYQSQMKINNIKLLIKERELQLLN